MLAGKYDGVSGWRWPEYDVDAQRLYERHGFSGLEPASNELACYYSQELSHESTDGSRTMVCAVPPEIRLQAQHLFGLAH